MGTKIEWEGENLQSIQLKEGRGKREEEGGRGNIGTREKGTCQRARSKLEVRRGLRCSFPKTVCHPPPVHKRIIGAGVPTLLSQLLLRKLVERCMTGTL